MPRSVAQNVDATPSEEALEENKFIALLPLLTAGLIAFLFGVFAIEKRFAFDVGEGGAMSLQSLIAFGGISFDRVVRGGEWWRIFLAPLLHANTTHLLGNCFALAFVGFRLEPRIGRGWFAAIFFASALGGAAGSLIGNPHGLTSVGASGAITGLIAALFAMSFHPGHDAVDQKAMRRTALRFGVPALAPLLYGASGQTDYFCHLGGAVAGVATGLLISALWSGESFRPAFASLVAKISLVGLVAAGASSAFAATHYSEHAKIAALFIPSAQAPQSLDEGAKHSAQLLARYPKDPRAHLYRAHSYIQDKRLNDAEGELRAALSLATGDAYRPLRELAQAYLAAVLADRGRSREARDMAREVCGGKDQAAMRAVMIKSRLCDEPAAKR